MVPEQRSGTMQHPGLTSPGADTERVPTDGPVRASPPRLPDQNNCCFKSVVVAGEKHTFFVVNHHVILLLPL